MKMTRMAFATALCLFLGVRADSLGTETSDAAAIDLTVESVTYALSDAQTVSVDYGSLYGDVETGTAQFLVNGAVKASGGTASTTSWKPTAAGTYSLEHRMLKNGEVVGTTLTVTHVVTADPSVEETLGSATSASTAFDLAVGPVAYALSEAQMVSVDYGSLYGDVENGTAQFLVNGEVKASGGTASTTSWKPTAAGTYSLEHRMVKNGATVGTSLKVTHKVTDSLAYVGVVVSDECEGMGTVTGGNKSFKAGAKVSLKATAKKGFVFAGWYLDDAIETIASTCVSQSSSYTYIATGEEDTTIYAKFIATEDDWVSVDCEADDEYVKGETIEPIAITVDSGSLATVKVTGLPAGMKFTAKALSVKATKTTDVAEYAANTIYGMPTKSGVYTGTVTATTAGKAKATKTLKFIVRGEGEAIVDADVSLVDAAGRRVYEESVPGKVSGMGVYATNKKVTLKATANKGYVFMGWYDDGDLVSRLASHVLTMPDYDVALEARFITAETDRAAIAASVGDEFWFDAESAMAEKTISAGVYLEWSVAAEALSVTTIKVTGLPTGLKFTAKDITQKVGTGKSAETVVVVPANTIYGTPSAASKKVKGEGEQWTVTPSQVKITVTTAGKNSQTFQIDTTVVALPEQVVGTFTGGSCGDPSGSATLTVAASGKVSGKWISEGKTWTLAASGFTSGEPDGYQFDTTLTAKCGKETQEIPLTVTSDGVASCDLFTAYWANWKIEPWKTLGKAMANKKCVFYIDTDGNTSEDAIDSPYGTVTLTMSANGTVKAAGSFVTGTNAKTGKDIVYKASGSTVLMPIRETTYRVFVYFPPKGTFEGYARSLTLKWDGSAFSE